MSKTIEQVRAELDAKIPRDAVKERSQGNFNLSYLEGHYVIDRLNQIFGADNWSKRISLTKTFDGEVDQQFYVSYVATIDLEVTFPNGHIKYTSDVGFGDGRDKKNPGKAHELAVKEAVTDGLKRCAKDLGMSMGLALYSKDQENVSEEDTTTTTKGSEASKPASKDANPKTTVQKTGQDYEAIKAVIKSAALVLDSKKTLSKDKFRELYLTNKYKVGKVQELSNEQAVELLNTLKTTYTELRLN